MKKKKNKHIILSKNRYIILSTVVITFIFLFVIIYNFFYKTSDITKILKKDIEYFNKLTQENNDIKICSYINNQEIKNKCLDNNYSINAFENLDLALCENIKNIDLQKACKKNIKKFNK